MSSTPALPRRKPGASGRAFDAQEPDPGAPGRALRARATDGWERFMRRTEIDTRQGAEECAPEGPLSPTA
ncbi:hypothetical protein GCM10010302_64640 [Streptomyces polychromogenes]|uniref:DUF397 domain-containing protein n=1 Tax=Streptomyces polychromogenes TaxID=67342 RepID=A0ABN0VT40_9ACTN